VYTARNTIGITDTIINERNNLVLKSNWSLLIFTRNFAEYIILKATNTTRENNINLRK
jgi:hypothetical protein